MGYNATHCPYCGARSSIGCRVMKGWSPAAMVFPIEMRKQPHKVRLATAIKMLLRSPDREST